MCSGTKKTGGAIRPGQNQNARHPPSGTGCGENENPPRSASTPPLPQWRIPPRHRPARFQGRSRRPSANRAFRDYRNREKPVAPRPRSRDRAQDSRSKAKDRPASTAPPACEGRRPARSSGSCRKRCIGAGPSADRADRKPPPNPPRRPNRTGADGRGRPGRRFGPRGRKPEAGPGCHRRVCRKARSPSGPATPTVAPPFARRHSPGRSGAPRFGPSLRPPPRSSGRRWPTPPGQSGMARRPHARRAICGLVGGFHRGTLARSGARAGPRAGRAGHFPETGWHGPLSTPSQMSYIFALSAPASTNCWKVTAFAVVLTASRNWRQAWRNSAGHCASLSPGESKVSP